MRLSTDQHDTLCSALSTARDIFLAVSKYSSELSPSTREQLTKIATSFTSMLDTLDHELVKTDGPDAAPISAERSVPAAPGNAPAAPRYTVDGCGNIIEEGRYLVASLDPECTPLQTELECIRKLVAFANAGVIASTSPRTLYSI